MRSTLTMRPRLPTDRERVVLLVEDDRDMLAVLRRNLELDGYTVTVALDGPAGLAAIRDCQPHLVVLDLMLPRMSGYDVLARARASGFNAPVLLLTARHGEAEKVRGFWHGADDYVTKPFSLPELLARVAVLVRRHEQSAPSAADRTVWNRACGPIEIDIAKRVVRCNGQPVTLSPKGYDLLLALVSRCGAVVARPDLLREVWGYAPSVTSRTLDAHIAELRRRLEEDPAKPRLIRTLWRVGYKLDADGGTRDL